MIVDCSNPAIADEYEGFTTELPKKLLNSAALKFGEDSSLTDDEEEDDDLTDNVEDGVGPEYDWDDDTGVDEPASNEEEDEEEDEEEEQEEETTDIESSVRKKIVRKLE